MRPEQHARDHGRARQKQQRVRGMHGRHLPLQDQIKRDPHHLVAEPERPARGLQPPEPAHAAFARHALPGKREQRRKHEQRAHNVAEPGQDEALRKRRRRRSSAPP